MKKFLGYILFVIGILINLIILLSVAKVINDIFLFVVMLFMMIPGALLIWIGVKLFKKKEDTKPQDLNSLTSDHQPPNNKENVLSDIKNYTAKKLSSLPTRGYTVSADEILESYFSFNDDKLPFAFYKSEDPKSHITAHWKFGDAAYLGIMGISMHNIQKEFNVYMKFDSEKSQIRCLDSSKSSSSSFSPFGGGMEFSSFSGKQSSISKEIHFGRKKDDSFGKAADISLDTRIIHSTIQEIADKNGWSVKRVIKL